MDMENSGASIRVAALLLLPLLVISLAMPALASETKVLSLEDCIGIAIRNNPEIGMAESSVKTAESGLLQSYGQLLPNLSASFTTGRAFYGPSSIQYDAQGRPVQTEGFDYNSYSFNMNSSITLFDGGRNFNTIRSSMKSRDAAREEFEYTKDIVTALVINKYYNFVRAKMLLVVAGESLDGQDGLAGGDLQPEPGLGAARGLGRA